MSASLITALVFTMVLVVVKGYFLMGSLPLLTLKHDTPLDARFVGAFFNTYYLATIVAAGATAVGYAFAGRLLFATGATTFALLAGILRRTVIPRMAVLGAQIQNSEVGAISVFRRLHMAAILVNLVQLVLIVWSLITLSMQMR